VLVRKAGDAPSTRDAVNAQRKLFLSAALRSTLASMTP
jgi:hypothetical protein